MEKGDTQWLRRACNGSEGRVMAQKGGEGAVRCIEVCDLAVFSFERLPFSTILNFLRRRSKQI